MYSGPVTLVVSFAGNWLSGIVMHCDCYYFAIVFLETADLKVRILSVMSQEIKVVVCCCVVAVGWRVM